MPSALTREPTKNEARKRRASERHAVGCCEELARPCSCLPCRKRVNGTNGNAPPLGGGRLQETLSAVPLRAQSNVRLHRTRRTRERGAHGCHRLRWLTCAPPHVQAALSELRPTEYTQRAGGKSAAGRSSTQFLTRQRIERAVGPTFFRSAACGLSHAGRATRSVAQNEARKRRASERPRVGCCEELAGRPLRC